ncbi:hypothetical protein KC316_g847 [Hortaea werneckii]|nr:hypothetical protein KC324_g920 [Hortaea werneckii]KAI7594943.1 hypothetical protein KC316_g847 [Hortaea werneckii]
MRLRQLQRNEAYLVKVKKAWQRHVPGISLEQAVSGIDDPTPTIGARTEDTAIPQGVRSIIHEEPSLATPDSTTSPAEQRNAEDYEFDESEDFNEAIDGMGFLTLESQKSGYTGPQSGIAAMCFLRSLPNDLELVQDVEPSAYPADSIPSHKSSPTAVNIDETINDYFALFHPAYPLLHEGLFRAQMAGAAPKPRDGSWALLYNMVLAVGAFVGDSNGSTADVGFYRRARDSISLAVLEKGSLCYVQGLVIMANYLQKRNKPNAGFALIGIAWSMALSIGLHREFGNFSTTPFTMELRRRTWWVLFIFVSGAQLTFGRPPVSLIGVNIRTPSNLEDSNLAMDMSSLPMPRDGPTVSSSLIAQIKLAVIANQVQTELLTNQVPEPGAVRALDEQIENWTHNLPQYLRAQSKLSTRLELPKQVLLWRSYHLRIVLHRPSLYVALSKRCEFNPQDQGVRDCIRTADTCVDAVHTFLRDQSNCKRGFAWYATYWLLSASFVHATCLVYAPRHSDSMQWRQKLERALEVLRLVAPVQAIAVRAQRLFVALIGRYESFVSVPTSATVRQDVQQDYESPIVGFPGGFEDTQNGPGLFNFGLGEDTMLANSAADLFWLWQEDVNADLFGQGPFQQGDV